jgi:hypothetical protein
MSSPTSSFNLRKDSEWSVITANEGADTSETANVSSPITSVPSPHNKEDGKPQSKSRYSQTNVDITAPGETLADSIWSDEMIDKKNELEKASETSNAKNNEMGTKKVDTNLIQNRYEVDVKLLDLQADPNSPLYSVKSFEELGL